MELLFDWLRDHMILDCIFLLIKFNAPGLQYKIALCLRTGDIYIYIVWTSKWSFRIHPVL